MNNLLNSSAMILVLSLHSTVPAFDKVYLLHCLFLFT